MSSEVDKEMDEDKKKDNFPAWLETFGSTKSNSNQKPNWFPSWKSSTTTSKPKTPESNLFNLNLNQGKNKFPVIEVNGPSIKLPSFPIVSSPIKLYSDIEKRTGSADISADNRNQNEMTDDGDFDLKFFPQR